MVYAQTRIHLREWEVQNYLGIFRYKQIIQTLWEREKTYCILDFAYRVEKKEAKREIST